MRSLRRLSATSTSPLRTNGKVLVSDQFRLRGEEGDVEEYTGAVDEEYYHILNTVSTESSGSTSASSERNTESGSVGQVIVDDRRLDDPHGVTR